MDSQTLDALNGSIAKWQAIVEGTGTNGGPSDCPLCILFLVGKPYGEKCKGCPVGQRTGSIHCQGSPYMDYEEMEDNFGDADELKELAQAELDFLRSLLPPALTPAQSTPNE